MSRHGFYWSKRNNWYDSILDLIGVSLKEDTDIVLLLDDYINSIYVPEILLTTAKLDLWIKFLIGERFILLLYELRKKILEGF